MIEPRSRAQAARLEMKGVPKKFAPTADPLLIGMIALSSGLTGEEEMHRILPPEEALLLTTRVMDGDAITMTNLVEIGNDLERAASTIVPGGHLDVVAYCCTAGAMALGETGVAQRIHAAHPRVPITTPYAAAIAAFEALGTRSISLLTPYTEAVTREIMLQLERDGIEVVRCRAFGIELTSQICRIAPAAISEAAVAADCAEAEAVFICCGGLRAAGVVEAVEAGIGKPVVSSNQALAWHALRLGGYQGEIPGFGRLLCSALGDRSPTTERRAAHV